MYGLQASRTRLMTLSFHFIGITTLQIEKVQKRYTSKCHQTYLKATFTCFVYNMIPLIYTITRMRLFVSDVSFNFSIILSVRPYLNEFSSQLVIVTNILALISFFILASFFAD